MSDIDNEVLIIKYYEAFLSFLKAVGSYQAIVKMRDNADDGVYVVQVVVAKYGYRDSAIDQEVIKRNNAQWSKLKDLNYWSRKAGFLPMNQEGMEKFLKFSEDYKRREYLRRKIKKLKEKGELMSIRDLMLARYKCEQKQKAKQ